MVPPIEQAVAEVVVRPALVVNLESLGAPIIVVVQADPFSFKKKRKSRKGEKSSSKRSRREGSVPRPLPGGLFEPAFHVGEWVDFRMSSSQRAAVEPMSEKDLTNVALEFTTRGAMLISYLRQFANRRGVKDV